MHTDETLDLLDEITIKFGKRLRHFQKFTCAAFKTEELRWETERRQRRQSRNGDPTALTPQTT